MYIKKTSLVVCLMYFFFFVWVFSVQAQTGGDDLIYQERMNDSGDSYYEGIKSRSLSAYDIELVSALVNYGEMTPQMPDQVKVRFCLPYAANVYLTVRELDDKYYYRLDNLGYWEAGFGNTFEWPTNEVIRRLDIDMYDLGIVARLNRAEPGLREEVAPVIFYHSQPPANIRGYLFTFKTSSDAYLKCYIYKQGGEALYIQPIRKYLGGRPFTILWNSTEAEIGFYDLVITGYFLGTNYPLGQTVSFYHRPIVK